MADFICLAMATQYSDNTTAITPTTAVNQQQNSFRRSTLFGRRRSSNAVAATDESLTEAVSIAPSETSESPGTAHIRIVPSIENPSRSLVFDIIERDLEAGRIIKIGRFTDRSSIQNHISFKSKVVSRSHCEIWLNPEGKILLRDTKSSSGTFLNHVRLSPANSESRPVEIKDGDLVQLGIDYQGGYEEIYRSVKMRFEINRPSPHNRPVSYTMSAFQNLRNLTGLSTTAAASSNQVTHTTTATASTNNTTPSLPSINKPTIEVEECVICLYALAPFQALFVAPCSHSFHFKCIRPLLDSYPGFQCPICRTYSDLDASVAIEAEEVIEKYGLGQKSEHQPPQPSATVEADIDLAENEEDIEMEECCPLSPTSSTSSASSSASSPSPINSSSHEAASQQQHTTTTTTPTTAANVTNTTASKQKRSTSEMNDMDNLPQLSSTLVACCSTSLSGLMASPTRAAPPTVERNEEEDESRDINILGVHATTASSSPPETEADHRATMIVVEEEGEEDEEVSPAGNETDNVIGMTCAPTAQLYQQQHQLQQTDGVQIISRDEVVTTTDLAATNGTTAAAPTAIEEQQQRRNSITANFMEKLKMAFLVNNNGSNNHSNEKRHSSATIISNGSTNNTGAGKRLRLTRKKSSNKTTTTTKTATSSGSSIVESTNTTSAPSSPAREEVPALRINHITSNQNTSQQDRALIFDLWSCTSIASSSSSASSVTNSPLSLPLSMTTTTGTTGISPPRFLHSTSNTLSRQSTSYFPLNGILEEGLLHSSSTTSFHNA